MVPIEINDINTVDADWSAVKLIFRRPSINDPKANKAYYADKAVCSLLLGQKPTARGGFTIINEVVADGIESLD
jgi:hypothetical protein